MEMSSNAFQHSGSEITIRPINGSSYSSLAKYLPLCVFHPAIIMATTVFLFYSTELIASYKQTETISRFSRLITGSKVSLIILPTLAFPPA